MQQQQQQGLHRAQPGAAVGKLDKVSLLLGTSGHLAVISTLRQSKLQSH